MWRERVLFVKVNERPFVTVFVHNAERREGEYQPKNKKKNYRARMGGRAEQGRAGQGRAWQGRAGQGSAGQGRVEEEGLAVTGTVWLDVEEFRCDGESKGPVRERPGSFEV